MAKNTSLKTMFESNKGELERKLTELKLPKDANRIQKLVSDYLSDILELDGEYRQRLSQSEDYILQATLRLLTAQENFTNGLIANNSQTTHQLLQNDSSEQSFYTTLIGTGIGAVTGGFFGTWSAVIGALAGNAVVAYIMTKKQEQSHKNTFAHFQGEERIDTKFFLNIVSNVCESIDGIVETYRIQVNRIVKEYKNRETPNLQSDYSTLLEQIVNVNKVASSTDVPDKLKQAVDLMVECLENYGLKIENNRITFI